jgi:hypothetical protein
MITALMIAAGLYLAWLVLVDLPWLLWVKFPYIQKFEKYPTCGGATEAVKRLATGRHLCACVVGKECGSIEAKAKPSGHQ